MAASAIVFTSLAIATDTAFYHGPGSTTSLTSLYNSPLTNPVITPWNNIRYNTQTSNLALHGLHPHHQHFLVNLPQLLGPALIILLASLQPLSTRKLRHAFSNPRFLSAITGAAFLSIFPHQEPRFLLPCIPLLLTCIRLPNSSCGRKWFWTSWLTFNILLGTLMGVYHQGGVIPAQLQVPEQIDSLVSSSSTASIKAASATVFWWRTYPPPTYLLGNTRTAALNISTVPLMGLPQYEMVSKLSSALPTSCDSIATTNEAQHTSIVLLIAPVSSHLFLASSPTAPKSSFVVTLPTYSSNMDMPFSQRAQEEEKRKKEKEQAKSFLRLTLQWNYRKHINLDDIEVGEEGLWGTLGRVVGRRGIGIWSVQRVCQVG
jgi:GPI mannosyltransferase 4